MGFYVFLKILDVDKKCFFLNVQFFFKINGLPLDIGLSLLLYISALIEKFLFWIKNGKKMFMKYRLLK